MSDREQPATVLGRGFGAPVQASVRETSRACPVLDVSADQKGSWKD